METKFNFNSQVCTSKIQSERLLALGLKKETADMCWIEEWGWDDDKQETFCTGNHFVRPIDYVWDDKYINYIPAWSLHRLVSMIEEDFQSNGRFFCLPMFGFDKSDNLYDNIIDAYEWLIKEGYFNKEYLV